MLELKDINEKDDYFLFYKVGERKYIESMVNKGQIYFGLLENYRRMEQHNMKEIGDRMEASLSTLVAEYIKIDDEYHEFHGPNAGCNVRINANQCAFCCYYVGLKRFQKISDNQYQFTLSASDIASICSDKGGEENCAIAIFDRGVVHKIYDALRNKHFSYAGKKVVYDDYNYIPEHDLHSPEYALECTFHKLKRYNYQREFRITALNRTNKPIDDLFINVEEKDFNMIPLEKDHNLNCIIEFDTREVSDCVVNVHFKIQLSLEKVNSNET